MLVAQWLVTEGMDAEDASEVLRSDYAGQANTKLKTQAARKTEKALLQRQAQHMAVN